jgi:hypothetical protein
MQISPAQKGNSRKTKKHLGKKNHILGTINILKTK